MSRAWQKRLVTKNSPSPQEMVKAFDTALLKGDRSAIVDFLINNGAKVDGYFLKMSPDLDSIISEVKEIEELQKKQKKKKDINQAQLDKIDKKIKDLEAQIKERKIVEEMTDLNKKVQRWMKLLRTVSSKILDDVKWHKIQRHKIQRQNEKDSKLQEPDFSLFNRRFSQVPAL